MPKSINTPTQTELHVSDSFKKSSEREIRTIDAITMLDLALAVISPPDCSEDEDRTAPLSFDVRHGLVNILYQAKESLNENLDAFCRCHEEKDSELTA
ncbi:MAG TPA: hypothetical protein ENJ30_14670 [Desulfobulbaceae bacterium]|nr:hypothetical protein [Desulfobulbaceae bacterium]